MMGLEHLRILVSIASADFGIYSGSWNQFPTNTEGQLYKVSVCYQTCYQLKIGCRASLVAQWLRVCLLMQGTRVRALVWEDPTCRGAARPVSHSC